MLNKARLHLSIWKDVISGHCFQRLWNVNISLPGHRSPKPGQLETWGCMTQANGISWSFPICGFNQFHSWASIPEKHTDIHKTPTGWATGCHRQDTALTAPPEHEHQCPNPLFLWKTQEVTHADAHMGLPEFMNTCAFTGAISTSMILLSAWQPCPDPRPSYWPQRFPHHWLVQLDGY